MSGSIRLPSLRAWCLLVTAGMALAGCQGINAPRPLDNDPLVGGSPIPGTPAGRLPEPGRPVDPVATAAVAGEIPPVPPPVSSTSPAALTLGAITPGEDRRTPGAGVILHGPRNSDARVTPTGGATPSANPSSPPSAAPAAMAASTRDSFEYLQQQLRARGVVWQQLRGPTGDPGEWHFICAIPDSRQSSVRRNYEARAVGPSGLNAMRAVLEEIDREASGQ